MAKYFLKSYGKQIVSYAQNSEDTMLYGYFHDLELPGFYVDIGANHPVQDSVTKFFSLRDWRGINVEPLANLCALLTTDRPKDINLAIGLSDKSEVATLRQYAGDGLSTFSSTLKKAYSKANNKDVKAYTDVKLKLRRLDSVLSEYLEDSDINFMKVDVEGYEYKVLAGNNWLKYRPWVVCVEATGHDKRWVEILGKANYIRHLYDGLNEYYVAAEHKELIDGYRAIMASEVIRYDIAGLPVMRYRRLLGRGRRAGIRLMQRKKKT